MLNYDYVRQIESNGMIDKIRHIKKETDVISQDDAMSGAGCTLL
jgi:hypothetical protein